MAEVAALALLIKNHDIKICKNNSINKISAADASTPVTLVPTAHPMFIESLLPNNLFHGSVPVS